MALSWYEDFLRDGYAVVPSVISKEKAAKYQQSALDWLKSFDNKDLDLSNPATWTQENLPYISNINTYNHYGVVHERFMWDIRLEQSIIDVFAQIWGTDELLVSFDALNVTLPRRPGHVPRQKWPHVDQSPFRQGLQCVQGIVNLSQSGPDDGGLTLYPRTQQATEPFFAEHTDKSQWDRKDFYSYTPEQIAWFAEQGYQEYKVVAEPGDLLIWDSRLIHFGAEPTEASNVIRTVTYVAYTPASFATEEALEAKRDAFRRWQSTTHWPHDNIRIKSDPPYRPDGTVDTRRTEPLEKPELTSRLLKLAGIDSY